MFVYFCLFVYLPFLFVSVHRRSDVAPTFRAEVARPALAAGRARHEHVRVRGTNGSSVTIRRHLRLCAHQLHRHHHPALNSITTVEAYLAPRHCLQLCAHQPRRRHLITSTALKPVADKELLDSSHLGVRHQRARHSFIFPVDPFGHISLKDFEQVTGGLALL